MQTLLKSLVLAALALVGLLTAAPALAQVYVSPSYYTAPSSTYYAQPTQAWCPQLTYNLVRGSSDYYTQGQVSQLQQFLRTRYGDARLTGGYYGSLTTWYVAKFQQEQGLYPVTGGVGPLTRAALQRICGGYSYPAPVPQQSISIYSLSPSQGAVGTQITIQGSGFTANNTVHFGNGGSTNVASYNNGTVIYYTVPQNIGPICTAGMACAQYLQVVGPGSYPVYVTNGYSQNSQALGFTVVGSQTNCGYYAYGTSCGNTGSVSVSTQSGPAPLSVTFTPATSGYYAVNFGDGTSASLVQGSVNHTYYNAGTYTAQFTTDLPCLHATPQCQTFAAQQVIGTVSVTAY